MEHSSNQDHGTPNHEVDISHDHGDFEMSSLLDGLPETQHNQLLEMLHVPLLHGGVKETILFSALTTSSDASFAFACIVLAIITCILELLRVAVGYLEHRYLSDCKPKVSSGCQCKHNPFPVLSVNGDRKNYSTMHESEEQSGTSSDSDSPPSTSTPSPSFQRSVTLASLGFLQMLTYLGSTLLMLIAMTMNIFLIVSLGVGFSIGKLISLKLKERLQATRK